MDIAIGRFTAQIERPRALKFALPIVLVPEMFTTRMHQATLIGYLANSGWQVYAPDFRAAAGRGETPAIGRLDFGGLSALVGEAIAALERDVIVMGHGIGGLTALAIAERPRVRAAIALAPLVPGLLYVRSWMRFIGGLDELQRRIQLEAWLFAVTGTVLIGIAISTLNTSGIQLGGLEHGLGMGGAFIVAFALWLVGSAIANCRYK